MPLCPGRSLGMSIHWRTCKFPHRKQLVTDVMMDGSVLYDACEHQSTNVEGPVDAKRWRNGQRAIDTSLSATSLIPNIAIQHIG